MATEATSLDRSTLQQRLLTEQVLLFCRYSRFALSGGVLAAIFVAYIASREQPLLRVAAWFVLLLAITVLRGLMQQRVVDGRIAITRSVVGKLMIMLALNGLIWSLPSTWLVPIDPTNQVILSLFMVGLSANSLISLGPVRHAYAIFLGTMMMPIAIYYFFLGDNFATSAIGIVAYTVVMVVGGLRQTQSTEDLIRLQLENADLAASAQRDKNVVDRANRDLQAQIEQRERTEAALRASKAEAESANRAKSQFLANMSHELRTPLNGILGTAELLQHALPTGPVSKTQKYVHTIRGAGERLLHLINDILDMARIEAGALRVESADYDPRALIEEITDLMTPQCIAKRLQLKVDVAPQVPKCLRGDAYRVRQILTNLIANAIKFTEHGGIVVALNAAPGDQPQGNAIRLRWSVTDTGIGIAESARANLFRPFSQVDDSSTRRFGGSGLGLAISQQLVHALGGVIDVDSEPSKGSTFWFDLPCEVRPTPPVAAAVNATDLPIATSSADSTVLVVEDNPTNGQLVTDMLALAGCHTATASNGIEALAKMERESFDLVLMDWHMPEMDGVQATRIWREREKQRGDSHIPIIALTASVLPGDRETCAHAGMDDFVGKPFTYDELISVVQRWLPKHA